MKIGIISDTHGNTEAMNKAILYLRECDSIIHAGDFIDDAEYIYYSTDKEVKCVKGNCDSYTTRGDYELEFTVNDKKFFLCHGHHHNVKSGLQLLQEIAKQRGIDFVVFGHTHIPTYKKMNNVAFINPGSITYPRGSSDATLGILTISEDISYESIKI